MGDLEQLQERLGYQFKSRRLLLEALSHPSYIAEHPTAGLDNQRLEFYGDAVIQLIVTRRLFEQFPDRPEGELTKMRAILTRQSSLAALARNIDLGPNLRMGKGEIMTDGQTRPSNLCDAFEALMAAIYLDVGETLSTTNTIVNRLIDEHFPEIERLLEDDNPKGLLQERLQSECGQKPNYELVEVTGPDHQRTFRVVVKCGDQELAEGSGSKRQKAEQNAARNALRQFSISRKDSKPEDPGSDPTD